MEIKPIKSDKDYREVLAVISRLIDLDPALTRRKPIRLKCSARLSNSGKLSTSNRRFQLGHSDPLLAATPAGAPDIVAGQNGNLEGGRQSRNGRRA